MSSNKVIPLIVLLLLFQFIHTQYHSTVAFSDMALLDVYSNTMRSLQQTVSFTKIQHCSGTVYFLGTNGFVYVFGDNSFSKTGIKGTYFIDQIAAVPLPFHVKNFVCTDFNTFYVSFEGKMIGVGRNLMNAFGDGQYVGERGFSEAKKFEFLNSSSTIVTNIYAKSSIMMSVQVQLANNDTYFWYYSDFPKLEEVNISKLKFDQVFVSQLQNETMIDFCARFGIALTSNGRILYVSTFPMSTLWDNESPAKCRVLPEPIAKLHCDTIALNPDCIVIESVTGNLFFWCSDSQLYPFSSVPFQFNLLASEYPSYTIKYNWFFISNTGKVIVNGNYSDPIVLSPTFLNLRQNGVLTFSELILKDTVYLIPAMFSFMSQSVYSLPLVKYQQMLRNITFELFDFPIVSSAIGLRIYQHDYSVISYFLSALGDMYAMGIDIESQNSIISYHSPVKLNFIKNIKQISSMFSHSMLNSKSSYIVFLLDTFGTLFYLHSGSNVYSIGMNESITILSLHPSKLNGYIFAKSISNIMYCVSVITHIFPPFCTLISEQNTFHNTIWIAKITDATLVNLVDKITNCQLSINSISCILNNGSVIIHVYSAKNYTTNDFELNLRKNETVLAIENQSQMEFAIQVNLFQTFYILTSNNQLLFFKVPYFENIEKYQFTINLLPFEKAKQLKVVVKESNYFGQDVIVLLTDFGRILHCETNSMLCIESGRFNFTINTSQYSVVLNSLFVEDFYIQNKRNNNSEIQLAHFAPICFDKVGIEACNQRGFCTSPNTCNCHEHYFGQQCEKYNCYGKESQNGACNFKGVCVEPDKCLCTSGFTGKNCSVPICFGNSSLSIDTIVCSNRGVCIDYDTCNCEKFYTGNYCEVEIYCNQISAKNASHVCSGRGDCVYTNKCTCKDGYGGAYCQDVRCFDNYGEEGCNNRGQCTAIDVCVCASPFLGRQCTMNGLFLLFIPILFGCLCCFIVAFLMLLITILVIKYIKKLVKTNNILKKQEGGYVELQESLLSDSFKIDPELLNFTNSEKLGQGAQGTVIKAKYINTAVACKFFAKSIMGMEQDLQYFYNEATLLAKYSNHINIVRFIGVCDLGSKVAIVTEFCINGNVIEFIERNKKTSISWKTKLQLLLGISNGMIYLHEHGVIHRDLKCENVLLDELFQPKIIDFGMSKLLKSKNTNSTNMTFGIGTAIYSAPEVVRSNIASKDENEDSKNAQEIRELVTYDNKCDVYSFAIIAWMLIFENTKPYGNKTDLDIITNISWRTNFRPCIEAYFSELFQTRILQLIVECWDFDPKKRPSFTTISAILLEILESLET